ncbi:hypothetical protein KFV02_04470 [Desulfohalobiaceae bacterium Ax17]|uniref:hypothetical protein n=1 Tax=Desulfovulcanus ferrireducens TaxID=2831190 RepID=UPI00207BA100|nr:hypothetical protein [Desulfovulcanus ferrireducens]MBT8763182.1 hypothetical protein [Desulfovulcanus ferrireducens]
MEEKYKLVTNELDKVLNNLPGKLVAIDGRDRSGKTTLGRFLAFNYNVSLIETDLFLIKQQDSFTYEDQINRIIERRLSIPRPVIVEGVAILKLLEKLKRTKDYRIYVENEEFEGSHGLSEKFK